jgi:predicted AAA+ superfamily ATPase
MDTFQREIEQQIQEKLSSNKVILLYGTRRVGKTFLLRSIIRQYEGKYLFLNGEDMEVQEVFQRRTEANYRGIIGDAKLLVIDEAQAIPNIGAALKFMIDTQSGLTILATGSSSLDLVNQSGEPLTGRQIPFFLYPLAQAELGENKIQALQNLEDRLLYGSYPEVLHLTGKEEKAAYLQNLVQSYLLKDILAYSGIRHSDKIYAILRMVAFQSGSEVSYSELSRQLGISKITVEHYLDLLSKVFILYKLPAFSNNQRNEIAKSVKWYFYDNGVRNAIINDFRPLAMRNDTGQLWEAYIISERIKKNRYNKALTQFYFWRNYQQQEIDLIEFENGQIRAFEIKYTAPKRFKMPNAFRMAYPEAECGVISREGDEEWIG